MNNTPQKNQNSAPTIALSIDIQELGNMSYTRCNLWYVAYVPISKIDYSVPEYDPYKINKNRNLINDTKTVRPIILGLSDTPGIYALTDGYHRCYCCNELGYTHIPALLSNKVKDNSFIPIKMFFQQKKKKIVMDF